MAKHNKHMKVETKQTNKNLGFLGNGITHARIGLCAHNQVCVRRQDYAYTSPCLENIKIKNKKKIKKKSKNKADFKTKI